MSRLWTVALVLVALAITACGTRVGTGGGGSGSNPGLKALITPIGYKATSNTGANPVTLTVRSGADVILSGKDSDGGAVALKSFAWAQTAGPALPALPSSGALLYRTANTVSFRAPQVAQDTALTFTLTVTDARGATATATASVTVKPIGDADQFLSIPTAVHRFEVAAATAEGLTGLSADVPVCISVVREVQYTSRDGTQRNIVLPQLTSLQADTAWTASAGGAAAGQNGTTTLSKASVSTAVNTYTNPRVGFVVPTFNDEDLFAMFNQPVANESDSAHAARLAEQLVPSDVSTAQLILSIGATPGSCDGSVGAPALAAKTLVVALIDSGGNVAAYNSSTQAGAPASLVQDKSGATLTSDSLLTSLTSGVVETAQSALAYYQALDPTGAKTTLDDWLDANCFDHTASDYGTAAAGANGAHAVYTNNFDLGFGRDMYFVKCAADHKDASGNVTARAGDMASVVVNYTSLEGAALRQGPIIAVAMEYGAAADGTNPTHRFPKFYVFAPDDRDGLLKRVSTANFDHRGQKYVPGACTSCHGGTLPTLPANFTSASPYPVIQDPTQDATQDATNCAKTASACLSASDVDAAFMPWDLDSFLYSDTDPAFTGLAVPPAPYTRAAQEPSLKALNTLVYGTFQPEIETVSVASNGTSSNVTIDRYAAVRALVEKWYGGANLPNATYSDTDTPAGWAAPTGADTLYHNAFARNCRACHTVNPVPPIQFTGLNGFADDGYTAFVAEFANQPTGAVGLGKAYTFQQSIMPAARLTMDRFWVNYAGGDSAAKVLATQLAQATGATDLLTSSGDAVAPGQPSVTVTVNGSSADATTEKFTAARFTGARVDAAASFFVAKYNWSLCIIATPGGACATAPVVGSTTAAPGIDTSAYGNYQLTLTADNGVGQTLTQTYEIDVPDTTPSPSQVSACPAGQSAPFSTTGNGASRQISVTSCFTALGDAPYTLQVSNDGVTYSATPISDPSLPWNASVVAATPTIDPVTGRDTSVPTISFNFTLHATGSTNNTVYYKLCDTDNECATGNSAIMLAGSLTPSSSALVAYWDPSVDAYYSAGAVAVIPGAIPILSSASLSTLTSSLVLDVPSTADVTLKLTSLSTGTLSSTQLNGTSPSNLLSLVSGLTYTPGAHCVNLDANGNALSAAVNGCTTVPSFQDTLSSTTVSPTPAAGTVTVNLQALASYNGAPSRAPAQKSVYSMLTENGTVAGTTSESCATSGCHTGAGNGTALYWTYTASDPATTYTSIMSQVVPGSPTTSPFYTAPCLPGAAGGRTGVMVQMFDPGSAECQIIYQWILEGAPRD
jgi:hypothetical protein